ncbi:MAG TPA: hypothetical protein DD454_00665 [Candidatus Moranbacteria bacterium]|nr:hypothetical protein [Candidatus Moranbacteria bacterium]
MLLPELTRKTKRLANSSVSRLPTYISFRKQSQVIFILARSLLFSNKIKAFKAQVKSSAHLPIRTSSSENTMASWGKISPHVSNFQRSMLPNKILQEAGKSKEGGG